ncbi:MAG: SH3-like domain-containing protein, partial [Clostridia bacterium]|nr:SH3-like domain-containing protein [Clostridia bacterium]
NDTANDKGDFVYVSGKNAAGKNAIVHWNGVLGSDISNDPLNKNGVVYAGNFALLGIATNNRDYPVVYGAKSMFNLNYIQSTNNHFSAEQGFEDFGAEEHDIVKVASSTTHLVILNDNNQLQVYQLVDGADGSALSATHTVIGSDQVKTAVPTTYTGFTLAKSSGYPTNIIYKTADDNTSIGSILTKDQVTEFVILDYAGAENSGYYYVFVNGKFGWIKKSDNATTPDTDGKIEIVNTKVSDKVTYNAKFNSLGKVYVYDLPCSNDNIRKLIDTVEQTGDEMTEVKILQQFKEENVTWYYVEYLEGKRGFVKSTDIGQFTATYVGPMDAVVDKQINASLFNAVTLHMTKELLPDSMFSFDGINPVKLYSGDWVKLIEVDEQAGAALIQVVCENGETAFGWVESSRLVEIDAITTNAIVGFVGLGIAVILAIIFASVFISRKKKVRK